MDVQWRAVVPDTEGEISKVLISWADTEGADLIVTTGGTGLSPRDVTPEATTAVVHRMVPGMAEAMRARSMVKTPHAMISRAVAGVRGQTLIINVPGSPKGALENLEVVMPAIEHALAKIQGDPSESREHSARAERARARGPASFRPPKDSARWLGPAIWRTATGSRTGWRELNARGHGFDTFRSRVIPVRP